MTNAERRQLQRIADRASPEIADEIRALARTQRRRATPRHPRVEAEKVRLAQKEEAGGEASAAVWSAVKSRAPHGCDVGAHVEWGHTEPHHLEGGRGRRQENESPRNVMAACRTCHDLFHARPSRYDDRIRNWCALYGYPLPPQVVKREVREKQKALREARAAARGTAA